METYLIENIPAIKEAAEKAETLEELEHHYSTLDLEIKKLTEVKDLLKSKILPILEKTFGHQGISWKNPVNGDTLQRVLSVYQNIDEVKLRKVLTKDQLAKVVEEKISMELLMAAIKLEEINPANIQDGLVEKEVEKLIVRRPK